MNDPMLIFETDPQTGTPKLKVFNGAAAFWNVKDLNQLEEQLRPRYEGLVREGGGAIEFKGRTFHIKTKDGDGSRQPTLELRKTDSNPPSAAVEAPEHLPGPAPTVAWGKGFLAEIDRLFASSEFHGILPVEKAMLHLVRDELRGLLERKPVAETALLVLASILMTAEHLSRTQRPHEPQPYAFALSGVEHLLSRASGQVQTPWGRLPAAPNHEPPPSWLSRLWGRWKGG